MQTSFAPIIDFINIRFCSLITKIFEVYKLHLHIFCLYQPFLHIYIPSSNNLYSTTCCKKICTNQTTYQLFVQPTNTLTYLHTGSSATFDNVLFIYSNYPFPHNTSHMSYFILDGIYIIPQIFTLSSLHINLTNQIIFQVQKYFLKFFPLFKVLIWILTFTLLWKNRDIHFKIFID